MSRCFISFSLFHENIERRSGPIHFFRKYKIASVNLLFSKSIVILNYDILLY